MKRFFLIVLVFMFASCADESGRRNILSTPTDREVSFDASSNDDDDDVLDSSLNDDIEELSDADTDDVYEEDAFTDKDVDVERDASEMDSDVIDMADVFNDDDDSAQDASIKDIEDSGNDLCLIGECTNIGDGKVCLEKGVPPAGALSCRLPISTAECPEGQIPVSSQDMNGDSICVCLYDCSGNIADANYEDSFVEDVIEEDTFDGGEDDIESKDSNEPDLAHFFDCKKDEDCDEAQECIEGECVCNSEKCPGGESFCFENECCIPDDRECNPMSGLDANCGELDLGCGVKIDCGECSGRWEGAYCVYRAVGYGFFCTWYP